MSGEDNLNKDFVEILKDSTLNEEAKEAIRIISNGGIPSGNQVKRPELMNIIKFLMETYDCVKSERISKPFNCSKCDKTFDQKEDGERCCDQTATDEGNSGAAENEDEDEESDVLDKGKSTPSQNPKNLVPRQGTSTDEEINDRPFKCSGCDKFLTSDETDKHKCEELVCQHPKCDKKFKKQAQLKKHEKTHTNSEHFTCTECDKKFTAEGIKYKGKLLRCSECHKKFMRDPINRPVCDFYKAGHCKYGPKGQNKEGKCYNRHPDPCPKFSTGKCIDKKCKLLHPAPVCTFFKKKACERKFCKFTHPKPAQKDLGKKFPEKPGNPEHKKPKNHDKKESHSDAHIVKMNSKIDTFLEEVSKRINQMESKIEANNNRMNFQSAAFPSMMMQQNPQLQTMQQRF